MADLEKVVLCMACTVIYNFDEKYKYFISM